tara:strand:+ start:1455 stop:1871 length:417 start_codon:yes stop_codon:yes gene_type:complete
MTITTKREVTTTWDVSADATLELSSFVTWNYQAAPLIILVNPMTTGNDLKLEANMAAAGATAVWVEQPAYSWANYIQLKGTGTDGELSAHTILNGETSYLLDRYATTSCNPQLRLSWAVRSGTDPGNVSVTVISPGTV